MLNSGGYHVSGTAAGQQQDDKMQIYENTWPAREQPGAPEAQRQHSKGPTAHTSLQSPILSSFNHVRHLANKIVTSSTLRDKLAAGCAFSFEACHSASVSAHITLAAYFHL